MSVISIDTLDDPRLLPYRNLKATNLTRDSGLFIAEGKRVVRRLLESRFKTESVLLSDRRETEFRSFVPDGVPVYVLEQTLAAQLVGYNFHVGVLACGRRPRERSAISVLKKDRLSSTLVACPNVDDPENLGSIMRISVAFGVDALLLGTGCCDPFSRRVLRVSMGHAFFLPVIECENLEGELHTLREEWHYESLATVLDSDAEPLETVSRSERIIVLLGNESEGLSENWVSHSDRRVTIPMDAGTDSLNVAVAAGIFLHHFTRGQRSLLSEHSPSRHLRPS